MVTRRYQHFLGAAILAAVASAEAQDKGERGMADAVPASVLQEKVREWVRAQKQRGVELADWGEQQHQLADLNELRRKEIAAIDQLITAAGRRLEEATKQREKLRAEQAELQGSRAQLVRRIGELEASLATRVAIFPDALRTKIPEAIVRLENPDASRSLQDRYRDVVAVLAAATEFSRGLSVASELRNVGGKQMEVEVLYAGLSGAWYVGRGGKVAGTRKAGAGGWVWVEDNSIADRVRAAIDMHRKLRAPGYVRLPFPARGKERAR